MPWWHFRVPSLPCASPAWPCSPRRRFPYWGMVSWIVKTGEFISIYYIFIYLYRMIIMV
jgi:hypothetical protein